MNIDWLEYEKKDHVLAWFLCEAMSEAKITKFGDFDSSKLEVILKVNGIEVPITGPMEVLQKQITDIEESARKEGFEQAKYVLQDKIAELLQVEV